MYWKYQSLLFLSYSQVSKDFKIDGFSSIKQEKGRKALLRDLSHATNAKGQEQARQAYEKSMHSAAKKQRQLKNDIEFDDFDLDSGSDLEPEI